MVFFARNWVISVEAVVFPRGKICMARKRAQAAPGRRPVFGLLLLRVFVVMIHQPTVPVFPGHTEKLHGHVK